jgi:succinate dehydrogenase / fumarate reductase cytochrome b subunit
MQKTLTLFDTTIGKKAVMAVTGLVLYGFVIVHMLGNLQVFLGPKAINDYAAALKATPPLLWGVRVLLLASVVLHVWSAVSLIATTAEARKSPYRVRKYRTTSSAALSMKYGGFTLLAFIIFHLAHFTAPGLGFGKFTFSHTDVYGNMVSSFSMGWVVAIYLVAQVFLGLHLYHGSWSLLQTLGLSHPRYDRVRKLVPQGLGLGVPAGNILIALSIYAGIVR